MRIDAALQYGTSQLADVSPSARLDAEILLAYCLGKQRSFLYTWPEIMLTPQQNDDFNNALIQRADLYPVAYLVGHQEFWSLTLKVTPDVLIPRADTELLVETALDKILEVKHPKILELGTGSGAIALALASERPDSHITATDISSAALKVASENRQSLSINNVDFIESDWFNDVPIETFDLIVSNPPYIDPRDAHLTREIRHEPIQALASMNKGLHDLAQIIDHAPEYLSEQGWLILEHGYDQGRLVSERLQQAAYRDVSCLSDLNLQDRINLGLKPSDI